MLRVEASKGKSSPAPGSQGTQGHSPLLLIPADAGTVLKVISVPKGSRPNDEGLLLEELHVFEVRPSASHLGYPHSAQP